MTPMPTVSAQPEASVSAAARASASRPCQAHSSARSASPVAGIPTPSVSSAASAWRASASADRPASRRPSAVVVPQLVGGEDGEQDAATGVGSDRWPVGQGGDRLSEQRDGRAVAYCDAYGKGPQQPVGV